MGNSCLRKVFFLVVAAWLTTGYAFGSGGNPVLPCIAGLSLAPDECSPDADDQDDSQSPSSNETDQEELEDDNDDTPVIQYWNHLPLEVEVNLVYQLQLALYREHYIEVVSPPPKF